MRLRNAGKLEAVCAEFEVPLAAAALQFSLGHPAVRHTEKSQFDSEKSQFDSEKSQFDTEKSQFDTEKSQFDTEKSQFLYTFFLLPW